LQSSKNDINNILSTNTIPSLIMLLAIFSELKNDSKIIDPEISNQLLMSVTQALEDFGYKGFIHRYNSSFSIRILNNILSNPGRNWRSTDIEEYLHISGATLRRHLAKEDTSFHLLLREARLYYGLGLLKTTNKSIKMIAHECGYSSPSCFTRNFISHFGIVPSEIKK
ncbi:AraC family transcriptional regulator, partial [Escherichia coli]|nr:AraC family transcriptional regulator [Escherichia coli]